MYPLGLSHIEKAIAVGSDSLVDVRVGLLLANSGDRNYWIKIAEESTCRSACVLREFVLGSFDAY
jgi:hypothetical protein